MKHALRRLAAPTLLLVALVSCGTRPQNNDRNGEFEKFFATFQAAVRSSDPSRVAGLLNFPFYVNATPHSRAEFEGNRDQTVNIFAGDVRRQILEGAKTQFVSYRNKDELDEDKPDFRLIPADSPVVEFDLTSARGGPALRLMFARLAGSYRLFCVTQ
jgi:hypothetical protein